MNKKIRIALSAFLLATCLGLQQPLVNVSAAKHASTTVVQPAKAGRQIKLQGAQNVRDLGGYVTKNGKVVKAHKILRAAALAKLTKADIKKLTKTYHLKTDIDLRSKQEVKQAPDVKIKGVSYKFNPVFPSTSMDMSGFANMQAGQGVKTMEEFYRTAVLSKTGRKAYKQVFKLLLSTPKNKSVLYHCTAGKDRTGMATALILSALKVDRKTIMQDYLLSNKYLAASNAKTIAAAKAKGASPAMIANLKAVMGVQKSYLNASFKAIDKKYGNVNNYQHKGLGLSNKDLQKLQKNYLSAPMGQVR